MITISKVKTKSTDAILEVGIFLVSVFVKNSSGFNTIKNSFLARVE